MNVLFVTIVLPGGLYGGGELWSQTIIEGLRRLGADVTVLGYQRGFSAPKPGEHAVGERTVETSRAPLSAAGWGARSLISGRPYTVQKWIGPDYSTQLHEALAIRRWDLVVINHAGSAWALEAVGKIPIVHVSHQAEAELYRRFASAAHGLARLAYLREGRLLARVERRLAQRADAVWCIGERDQAYFHALGAAKAIALPPLPRPDWMVATDDAREDGPDLALLGSWTWKPNRESLRWFLEDVRPRLPEDWAIAIGGKYDASAFADFPETVFAGVVDDPCVFLRAAKRIAVPSRGSLGAPLKLLDAIAANRPVVANGEAIERIGAVPRHVVGAASAEEFAANLRAAPPPDTSETAAWLSARQARFDALMADSLALILG